jgi:hypothetical protein
MALFGAITTTAYAQFKAIGPCFISAAVTFSVNIRYLLSFKAPSSATGKL